LLFGLPDSDVDGEHSIIITGTRKSRSFARLVHKRINPMNNEMNQFIKSSHFSNPDAFRLYFLVSALNQISLQILWFAILELTKHFLLRHIDNDHHETLFNSLQNEASRLTNDIQLFTSVSTEEGDVVSPVNTILVPLAHLHIQPCLDLCFYSMRRWTPMESMQCSSYMATRPKLWTHEGRERVRFFV